MRQEGLEGDRSLRCTADKDGGDKLLLWAVGQSLAARWPLGWSKERQMKDFGQTGLETRMASLTA